MSMNMAQFTGRWKHELTSMHRTLIQSVLRSPCNLNKNGFSSFALAALKERERSEQQARRKARGEGWLLLEAEKEEQEWQDHKEATPPADSAKGIIISTVHWTGGLIGWIFVKSSLAHVSPEYQWTRHLNLTVPLSCSACRRSCPLLLCSSSPAHLAWKVLRQAPLDSALVQVVGHGRHPRFSPTSCSKVRQDGHGRRSRPPKIVRKN